MQFEFVHNADPHVNDQLMGALPPYSMVVNATGMGKDIPGSPITDQGLFPEHGIAWELNYRGERDFMHQARAQVQRRNLRVEGGWGYFLLGWSTVVSQVFKVEIAERQFAQLAEAALDARGRSESRQTT